VDFSVTTIIIIQHLTAMCTDTWHVKRWMMNRRCRLLKQEICFNCNRVSFFLVIFITMMATNNDAVYGAVIMAKPLQHCTWRI